MEWKYMIFSMGRLEWEKVYDELKTLQLQNTRGHILWKSEGNSRACNLGCRALLLLALMVCGASKMCHLKMA
jgi:hypothetical protein